jgi:prefoldin subunit 5
MGCFKIFKFSRRDVRGYLQKHIQELEKKIQELQERLEEMEKKEAILCGRIKEIEREVEEKV